MSVLKTMSAGIAVALVIALTAGCGTTSASSRGQSANSEPSWVKNPASAYAKDAYLYAIGEGQTLQDAQDIAMENMARLFSTSVQSDRTVRERYAHAVRNGVASDASATDMTAHVRTTANVSALIGVSLDKTWTSPEGRVYVLAALDRKKARDEYARMIADNNVAIESLITRAAAKKGTLESYSCYSFSAVIAKMNNEYITILAVVDPAMSKVQAALCASPDIYTVQATEAAHKITFAVSVSGDRENRLTNAFSSVLTDLGFAIAGQSGAGALKYTVIANCTLSPSGTSADEDMRFSRYEVRASVNDVSTGKTVLPFSLNGRSAHVTQPEADQKALRTAENKIKTDFAASVTAWIDGLAGMSR